MFRYTEEHLNFLREEYPKKILPELTRAFNQRFGLNKSVDNIHSLVKRKKIRSGRSGCFEKGIRPWNTGTVGVCKPNSGSFQKGQTPKNFKAAGYERVNVEGYIEIKVDEPNPYTPAETRYRYKHVRIWEEAYGEVPEGHVLRFKDGNKLNTDLANIELVTQNENLQLNRLGYQDCPEEFKPTIKKVAQLTCAMRDRVVNSSG